MGSNNSTAANIECIRKVAIILWVREAQAGLRSLSVASQDLADNQ